MGELLSERVVRSGQSSCSEYPSSLTLGESLLFLRLSFPFGKKDTELGSPLPVWPPVTQRSLFMFKSHVRSSDNLFDTAPPPPDGWTSQLAQLWLRLFFELELGFPQRQSGELYGPEANKQECLSQMGSLVAASLVPMWAH